MSFEIDHNSIVKLMLQYCKENNLNETFKTLQEESKINLNTVDSKEDFTNDILNGRWDQVLKNIQKINVPYSTLMTLYEQICFELVEHQENDVASELINDHISISVLKNEFPDRYYRLEQLINSNDVNIYDIYSKLNTSKDKNRKNLADLLSKEVCVVLPNRLIYLLSQSVKQLENEKIIVTNYNYDLFTGLKLEDDREVDEYVNHISKTINFGVKSYIESAKISPDGNYLATGSVDGFIEIWDPLSGKLKNELTYQTENNLMFHKDAVLCLNFSKESKMICSGDSGGTLKIFKVANGKCLREFTKAHAEGITTILFTKDSTLVISASFDSLIRIFGLKSGKQIKELKGHTSFINDIALNQEGIRLISASSDGTVGVWDMKSNEILNLIQPPQSSHINQTSVNNICFYPKNNDQFFICNKSYTIYLMNFNGQLIKSYSTDKHKKSNFVYCCVSFQGEWLYAVDEDNDLTIFSTMTTKVNKTLKIHDKEVIGLTHHPHRSILISFALDGNLNVYTT